MKKKRLNPETNVEEEYEDNEPEEEDVTDRLDALEKGQTKIFELLDTMSAASKTPETPTLPEKDTTPKSPEINLESPFKTVYIRKRWGRIVARQVPKDSSKEKAG